MKRLFLAILIFLMVFTGCSADIAQPTMEELLAEVNAEHQAVQKPEVSVEKYPQYISLRSPIEQELQPAKPDENGGISIEQAEFDVNLLFDTLHRNYGLYDFYGGDDVFETARNKTLADCENSQQMDADVLQQIILNNLSFITDQHFSVGGEQPSATICPCFFTEVSFQKTHNGYVSEDRRIVKSVEGQDDLDALFKRSLTKEGKIVYWPITFAEKEEAKNNPPSLKIDYTDGSSQTITAQPYQPPQIVSESKEVEVYEEKGIPVIFSMWAVSKQFSNTANQLIDQNVGIVDLTCNTGGNYNRISEWWKNYLDEVAPTNSFGINCTPQLNVAQYLEEYSETMGIKEIDGWLLTNTWPDTFVDNPNLLVILTSKWTASSAEMFVDGAHNVQNTLIIGENTGGCYTNNLSQDIKLTYSRIEIMFGDLVTIFPDEYYIEGYGFEPDLWCPAVYAEEAAVNLIHNLMK